MANNKNRSGKKLKRASSRQNKNEGKDFSSPVLNAMVIQAAPVQQEPYNMTSKGVARPDPASDPETAIPSSTEGVSTQIVEETTEFPAGEAFPENEEIELLAFYLGQEEYAVDIMMIQEITKLSDVTYIPRTPSYIKGIITLRGNVIPVFDVHHRLGLDPFTQGGKSRFIICSTKKGVVAMRVDAITDVVRLKRGQLELPPSGVEANDAGFIKNIGRNKNRLLILLDIEKALQIDQ